MHPSAKDLHGQRFGRLLALEPTEERRNECIVWRCQCDCGQTCLVSSSHLISGGTKSCGCLVKEHAWKSGASAKPPGVAAGNGVLRRYKIEAARKKVPWELTNKYAFDLFGQNCCYCGASPSNLSSHPKYNGGFIYNGIDRVDNAQGYTEANCVPCCKYCNRAKNTMSLDEFRAWVTRVYEYTIRQRIEQLVNHSQAIPADVS